MQDVTTEELMRITAQDILDVNKDDEPKQAE